MQQQFFAIDTFRAANTRELHALYERIFQRVTAHESALRAFETARPVKDKVMRDLDALIAAWPDPADRPPLFGVPVGVKGLYRVDGESIRCGSLLPADLFSGPEAPLVTALRHAGAVILGITATTEFASKEPAATANPHNHRHTPGGSSSGSAAGVAAGYFPLALGTQTLGSIIRPASYCGVTGFKPTYGAIAKEGVIPFAPSLDTVGFFCATPGEIITALTALAPEWAWAKEQNERTNTQMVVRLGVPAGPYLDQAAPAPLAAFHTGLAKLTAACNGCLQCVTVPCLEDIVQINQDIAGLSLAEMAHVHSEWFDRFGPMYRPGTREQIIAGRGYGPAAIQKGQESQRQLQTRLRTLMREHNLDAWACPSAVGEADAGLAGTGNPIMNHVWTHAGLPALSLPMGKGKNGLPLGLQLVGDHGADVKLLSLGNMLFSHL